MTTGISTFRHRICTTVLLIIVQTNIRIMKMGDQQTTCPQSGYRNRNHDQGLQGYPQDRRSASWRHRSFL